MTSSLAEIKSVYPCLADAVNRRAWDQLDQFISRDIQNHGVDPADPLGAARFKRILPISPPMVQDT